MLRKTSNLLHPKPPIPLYPKLGWSLYQDLLVSKVVPGLYIGNFRDSKDLEQLRENKITHILSIHDNARKIHKNKEYLCILASDSPGQNLTQYFSSCNDFIHSARLNGGNVLVHCLAGVSRSVTISVAYLMSVTGLNWRETLNAVRGARNVANPNFGFQRQLHDFEVERLADERRRLKEKYPYNPFTDEEDCRKLVLVYHNSSRLADQCEAPYPQRRPPLSSFSHINRLQSRRSSSKDRSSSTSSSRTQSPARQPRSQSKDRTPDMTTRPP
uniref:Dual specificity protein phosphatase 15 n=1 Tax=Strigamia maritima TaxID=126957 RepID=T1J292_STRMM